MDARQRLGEEKKKVDSVLGGIIGCWSPADRPGGGLAEAMVYSLRAGGKRIRPVLTVAACRACGGPDDDMVYRAACALEMIHTYTLIHDDLPVMDDDDLRRGMPTCHRRYGVRRAVLAGGGLLMEAFAVLADAARELGLDGTARDRVSRVVARAIGGAGVVGGQVVDLLSENTEVSMETLEYIHSHKTAALLEVSCTLGGMLARAGERRIEALSAYGRGIGLAFQITDDLLDVEGDSAELGKTAGADIRRGKATYPSLYGIERSRHLAAEAVEQAIHHLADADIEGDGLLGGIAELILTRRS